MANQLKNVVLTMLLAVTSTAQAGFLDSLSTIRNVVGDIGYTANVITVSKQATKNMTDDLGITGQKPSEYVNVTTQNTGSSLVSGEMLVGKLTNTKLYATNNKTTLISSVTQNEPMVYLGEEKDGFLRVSTDKGEGWVEKPLVARR